MLFTLESLLAKTLLPFSMLGIKRGRECVSAELRLVACGAWSVVVFRLPSDVSPELSSSSNVACIDRQSSAREVDWIIKITFLDNTNLAKFLSVSC